MRSVMEIMRGHPVLYGLILAACILEGLVICEYLEYLDMVIWSNWFYISLTAVLSCLVVTLWREERGGTRLWQEALGGLAGIVVGFGICLLDSAPGMEIFGVCAGLVLVLLFLYSGRRLLFLQPVQPGFCGHDDGTPFQEGAWALGNEPEVFHVISAMQAL